MLLWDAWHARVLASVLLVSRAGKHVTTCRRKTTLPWAAHAYFLPQVMRVQVAVYDRNNCTEKECCTMNHLQCWSCLTLQSPGSAERSQHRGRCE